MGSTSSQTDNSIIAWAGFTWSYGCACGRCDPPGWVPPGFTADDWEYARKIDTTSLDWIFKWCVPKLGDKGFYFQQTGESNDKWLVEITYLSPEGTYEEESGVGNTPGEALRAAIVALIEQQEA